MKPKYKSDFLNAVSERGYISNCSDIDNLDKLASEDYITAYIGFDCTASSLHAGSLLPIMLLRWLQKTGHKPIVLMGGGTTRVGDPSGKDESRLLIDDKQISKNMIGIREIFSKYLTFGKNKTDAIMPNNAEWLDNLNYIRFLREYGTHFTINRMLKFDSVKLRLDREQPLSFLEFNYMILQAYDFLELARRYNCNMQMGGSDQWGNILNGIELGRRVDQINLYGLTSPLLTSATGQKMGKTASGAIWLDSTKTSAYEFWQYWRNSDDQDVGRYLRLFTELPIAEITKLEGLQGSELNDAKIILATHVTAMCHGQEEADSVALTAKQTFDSGGGGAGSELPTIEIPKSQLELGITAFALLTISKLTASKGEARRLIKGGGCKINDQVIKSELQIISSNFLNADGKIKISAGKKRHLLILPVE